MHRALEISEILLEIFGRCRFPDIQSTSSDLPALARTCRTFKEPALDLLWRELVDPSPLAQCLPEACTHQRTDYRNKCYSFSRSLTQAEWSILRSYTTRILSIEDCDFRNTVDWKSIMTLLNPPVATPLFPNLLHLQVMASRLAGFEHLFCMHFPSLVYLRVSSTGGDLGIVQDCLASFSTLSPNIRNLVLELRLWDARLDNITSSCISRWRNLQSVNLLTIALDADAFAHLSHLPALSTLVCTLSSSLPKQITPSDSPLLFSNLFHVALRSGPLDSISCFLSQVQLPIITTFSALIEDRPFNLDLSSFFTSIHKSCTPSIIRELRLIQKQKPDGDILSDGDTVSAGGIPLDATLPNAADGPKPVLSFQDLQPYKAFNNLRVVILDIEWTVALVDNDLLSCTSLWPKLERLEINEHHGWDMPSGITPNGLLQLWQICSSLSDVILAMDTRGLTTVPPIHRESLPPSVSFRFIDTTIEAESVSIIATFFAAIATHVPFSLEFRGAKTDDNFKHWMEVRHQIKELLRLAGLVTPSSSVSEFGEG